MNRGMIRIIVLLLLYGMLDMFYHYFDKDQDLIDTPNVTFEERMLSEESKDPDEQLYFDKPVNNTVKNMLKQTKSSASDTFDVYRIDYTMDEWQNLLYKGSDPSTIFRECGTSDFNVKIDCYEHQNTMFVCLKPSRYMNQFEMEKNIHLFFEPNLKHYEHTIDQLLPKIIHYLLPYDRLILHACGVNETLSIHLDNSECVIISQCKQFYKDKVNGTSDTNKQLLYIADYFEHDLDDVNKKVIFVTNQSNSYKDVDAAKTSFRQLLGNKKNLDVVSVNVDLHGRLCFVGLSEPYNNALFTKQGSFKCLSDFLRTNAYVDRINIVYFERDIPRYETKKIKLPINGISQALLMFSRPSQSMLVSIYFETSIGTLCEQIMIRHSDNVLLPDDMKAYVTSFVKDVDEENLFEVHRFLNLG
ncbi:hypothetical protein N9N03_01400 [Chlamydiia bacterium]|nr:hypothetical protein [Chlamydiia bacterium]